MTQIRLPTPLRSYAEGKAEVEVDSGHVAGALQQLVAHYPALRPHLFGKSGRLRPYINLFVNNQDIRSLNGEDTSLANGDRLMILPSIAGGVPTSSLRAVDHNALRTNQAAIIASLLAGFVLNAAWLVIALAGLNLFGGFCVGCAVYYWFSRLRLPGFSQAPPADTVPGRRPKE